VTSVALRCRVCEAPAPPAPAARCERCDGPIDFAYDWERVRATTSPAEIAARAPSMWRYRELLPIAPDDRASPGWTPLLHARRLSAALGIELHLKLEEANPTHSFKDRTAALARAAAVAHGLATLCCSSTGNLGDAVASQAAAASLEAIVLAPAGEATIGAIALAAGAHVVAIDGTYDDCRRLELELAQLFPWGFLAGNLRPYASEGAKTIAFEIAEQLDWQVPDAVVCPAATGALLSKVAQGFSELELAGLTSGARPRVYGAQAEGTHPIAAAFADDRAISRLRPSTSVASLAVGNPPYGDLAIGAARASGGSIFAVAEDEIDADTAFLARMTGIHADRAGGAALAALLRARATGEIAAGERVVLVVTGADVKRAATDAVNAVEPALDAVLDALVTSV
jgi:threonine synthase